ncbi:4-alpha-glucanotransferase [Pelomyxa schiedti]|nr:4-alpha-glucanotransferase [Pelomyxa schiedti]
MATTTTKAAEQEISSVACATTTSVVTPTVSSQVETTPAIETSAVTTTAIATTPSVEEEAPSFVAFDAEEIRKLESNATYSPAFKGCGVRAVTLRVHYETRFGQSIRVSAASLGFGAWGASNALKMKWTDNHVWQVTFPLNYSLAGDFEYKYIVMEGDYPIWESGPRHVLHFDPTWSETIVVEDLWNPSGDPENAFLSSAFTDVIFRRQKHDAEFVRPNGQNTCILRFKTTLARIPSNLTLCIIGSHPSLGAWNEAGSMILNDSSYPVWQADVEVEVTPTLSLEYKFGMIDLKTRKVVSWEDGPNRSWSLAPKPNSLFVHVAQKYRFSNNWKGTGVALPVFSLRSEESTGVGEFLDLVKLIDWAKTVGIQLIQLLPINDTVSKHKWTDSYPYSAISVHALNPIYLNLQVMGSLHDNAQMRRFERVRSKLNQYKFVNWEEVMEEKLTYAHFLFAQDREEFLKSAEFQEFYSANKDWLLPHAVFSCLRDKFGTADYRTWPKYHTFCLAEIEEFAAPNGPNFEEVSFHWFLQYHLHVQMLSVATHARQSGVVLKGDLPIGICRNSVDAWTEPHYFNMDYQTGAPPDFFALEGQNWGFPTYNWERMREDGFSWWKRRLSSMEKYFDAFRIDHILGFFRIWEIPYHVPLRGLLGQFSPSVPFGADELRSSGLYLDYDRLCLPYIRDHFLGEFVGGENVAYVKRNFLVCTAPNCYSFKPEFDTQRKVYDFFEMQKVLFPADTDRLNRMMMGLWALSEQVCLLEVPGSNRSAFAPRYFLNKTKSFEELDDNQKRIIYSLHTHFFYHRQDHHWGEKAAIKLPSLKAATRMLVCGEDLGDRVPEVVTRQMKALEMLSLFIERMPKDSTKTFANPDEAPFLSVVSTSSHDMPSLRGWYQAERRGTGTTLNDIWRTMRLPGHPSGDDMPGWVAEEFIKHHLRSPAMWSIFPLQDLLAIDESLRLENPEMEQINHPPNPMHFWRFRFHLTTTQLLTASKLNNQLATLNRDNYRGCAF